MFSRVVRRLVVSCTYLFIAVMPFLQFYLEPVREGGFLSRVLKTQISRSKTPRPIDIRVDAQVAWRGFSPIGASIATRRRSALVGSRKSEQESEAMPGLRPNRSSHESNKFERADSEAATRKSGQNRKSPPHAAPAPNNHIPCSPLAVGRGPAGEGEGNDSLSSAKSARSPSRCLVTDNSEAIPIGAVPTKTDEEPHVHWQGCPT